MSQRNSEYERIDKDAYQTPPWVTRVLIPHIPSYVKTIWEPAAGEGKMAMALVRAGYYVRATDIITHTDFLMANDNVWASAIITNPPYSHAEQFLRRAIFNGWFDIPFIAMLLRVDYDSAKTRADLFRCPFAKKIVLTDRIVWKERTDGKKAAPSENHAWYCWDWKMPRNQDPVIKYGGNDHADDQRRDDEHLEDRAGTTGSLQGIA